MSSVNQRFLQYISRIDSIVYRYTGYGMTAGGFLSRLSRLAKDLFRGSFSDALH